MAIDVGATVREKLYEFLSQNSSRITRWYQPFFSWSNASEALDVENLASLPKPYGVIVLGPERKSPESEMGYIQPVELWPYFTPGNFVPVDEARMELGYLLNEYVSQVQLDDGSTVKFMLQYEGSGRDYYDEELNAITRRMNFRMPRIRTKAR